MWEFVVHLLGKSTVHPLICASCMYDNSTTVCQPNNMKHQQELLYLLCENLLCTCLVNPRYILSCAHVCWFYSWQPNNKNCAAAWGKTTLVYKSLLFCASSSGPCWFYSSYQPNNMKEQQELHCSLCKNLLAILCNLFKGKNHWFVNYCYFVHHPLLVYAGSIPPTTQSYQPNNNKN